MIRKMLCTTGKDTTGSICNFQKRLQNLVSAMIASGYKIPEKEEEQSLTEETKIEKTRERATFT